MCSNRFLMAFAVGFMMLGSSSTGAAPITFEFAGIIDSVDDPDNVLDGAILAGDSFSGSYTFESTLPDSFPDDPEFGRYGPPGPDIVFSINTWDIPIPADNSGIGVGNLTSSSNPRDMYSVGAQFPFSSGDVTILEIGLLFKDDGGFVFSNDSLPLTPPDLSAFEVRSFTVQGEIQGSSDFFIVGTVTSLTPEPSTLVFLGIAAVTVLRTRSRR